MRALAGKLSEQAARLWSRPRSSTPKRAEVGGPLDTINDQFHDSYHETRSETAREAPVFVVLADELVVFQREQRTAYSFSPRAFHVIKSVTHAPLAIFATLQRLEGSELDRDARKKLDAQHARFTAALSRIERDASALTAQTRADLRTVLQTCVDYLDRAPGSSTAASLAAFARPLGDVLLRLADDATQLQLDALHAHAEQALSALSARELAGLQVVVAGDHQARARSLAMQYFQQRLREPEHTEQRVTYAEGVSDEEGALALVGTRRLDRALAGAFFGDEKRLQRDILGDSAHARLQAADYGPIDP
ncbi:MAG: hypothetical protein JWN48_3645 [Myxococcaceae bacterium]|nr:hypothetical protein [Myxococcaceae bacterium]